MGQHGCLPRKSRLERSAVYCPSMRGKSPYSRSELAVDILPPRRPCLSIFLLKFSPKPPSSFHKPEREGLGAEGFANETGWRRTLLVSEMSTSVDRRVQSSAISPNDHARAAFFLFLGLKSHRLSVRTCN
jgi:hypothetical protein